MGLRCAGVITAHWCCENRSGAPSSTRSRRTRDRVARTVLENGPTTAAALAEQPRPHPGRGPPPPRRAARRRADRGARAARQRGPRPRPPGPAVRAHRRRPRRLRPGLRRPRRQRAALPRRDRRPRGGRRPSPASGSPSSRPATARSSRRLPAGERPRRSPRRSPPTATLPRRARPGSGPAAGEQLCQHHCPVAHVAEQFPELCEAETEVFAAPARHPRPTPGHHRPRRRRLHHLRPAVRTTGRPEHRPTGGALSDRHPRDHARRARRPRPLRVRLVRLRRRRRHRQARPVRGRRPQHLGAQERAGVDARPAAQGPAAVRQEADADLGLRPVGHRLRQHQVLRPLHREAGRPPGTSCRPTSRTPTTGSASRRPRSSG